MEISVEGVVLPNKPLTNIELLNAANKLGIPNFRGVFQRDALPKRSRKGVWYIKLGLIVRKW